MLIFLWKSDCLGCAVLLFLVCVTLLTSFSFLLISSKFITVLRCFACIHMYTCGDIDYSV